MTYNIRYCATDIATYRLNRPRGRFSGNMKEEKQEQTKCFPAGGNAGKSAAYVKSNLLWHEAS